MNRLTNTIKHVLTQSPRNQADSFNGGNKSEVTAAILRTCEQGKFVDNSIGFNGDNFNFMKSGTSSTV